VPPRGESVLRVSGADVIPLAGPELNRHFPGRAGRRATNPGGLRAAWAALDAAACPCPMGTLGQAKFAVAYLDGVPDLDEPDATHPLPVNVGTVDRPQILDHRPAGWILANHRVMPRKRGIAAKLASGL
jgi:hypothetical protein